MSVGVCTGCGDVIDCERCHAERQDQAAAADPGAARGLAIEFLDRLQNARVHNGHTRSPELDRALAVLRAHRVGSPLDPDRKAALATEMLAELRTDAHLSGTAIGQPAPMLATRYDAARELCHYRKLGEWHSQRVLHLGKSPVLLAAELDRYAMAFREELDSGRLEGGQALELGGLLARLYVARAWVAQRCHTCERWRELNDPATTFPCPICREPMAPAVDRDERLRAMMAMRRREGEL